MQAARCFEERRTLNNDYATALISIQKDINNCIDLAKLWEVKDWNGLIIGVSKIKDFMVKKRKLSVKFP